MNKIVIIGSGNLAEALACAIAAAPALELVQLFGRNRERVAQVAALAHTLGESDPTKLAEADLYLIAVSDRAVGEVAERLPIPVTAAVAHTAGSVPIEALPECYTRRGVFYPMQTFTKGRRVDFGEIPIFVEAATPTLYAELEGVARQLSATVIPADSARRSKIHLAAVFACNFANEMYAISDRIVQSAGLDFGVMKALVRETAAKACDTDHPETVQTGPAVRNDLQTQQRHRALLDGDPETETIYSTISKHIWETSKKI